ncbi:uncharacterized protein Z519_05107 [Cladophialophora bantiana CBS 173.52]|uniref:Uncharacterized protein n=1 Tax=Cladophialophora bantiana (strain ATCC 10958 / CBS 173.52 / CDC B-1940 / NIH 8579) TaxID=1442370 RepID=A0A0D2G585_CLAB1|nr:uncharacterized protein Z519_05107 [Cladophialophora bantiana CBS 173.52]KIW93792.1 hypothetical protein Z519_05107 [Cladophialophora bantiana CBS 173.52]
MSSWLYQFWLFAFATSKHWGQEPRTWARHNLDFDTYEGLCSSPSAASPTLFIDSPSDVESTKKLQRFEDRHNVAVGLSILMKHTKSSSTTTSAIQILKALQHPPWESS